MNTNSPLAELGRKIRDDYVGWVAEKTLFPVIDLAFSLAESHYKPTVALENGWTHRKQPSVYYIEGEYCGSPAQFRMVKNRTYLNRVISKQNTLPILRINGNDFAYGPNNNIAVFEIKIILPNEEETIGTCSRSLFAEKIGPKGKRPMDATEIDGFYDAFSRQLEGFSVQGLDPLGDLNFYKGLLEPRKPDPDLEKSR